MARKSPRIRQGSLIFAVAVSLGGCAGLSPQQEKPSEIKSSASESESEAHAAFEKEASGFSLAGFFSGKKKKKQADEKPEDPSDPIPRKVEIGTVHFVHDQGGFVLIETTSMTSIPDQAELMTYSPEGKPTGKLRISPERKGHFLVADILGGSPQGNDRVMLFGMAGADGRLMFGTKTDPDAPEVLE